MSRMWVLALAGAVLLVPPLTAQASEFCPPPQAPPGFSLTPDGRAFHGAPTIERLQIGINAAIPCRAIRDSPGSLCGSYQLRYVPWDPYPQLAILRIMNSAVAYHAVIERLAKVGDQMVPVDVEVDVEVIDGFTNPRDAQQFAERLHAASGKTRTDPASKTSPVSYPVVISTRARLSPLCDQEAVICQFHDQPSSMLQGADWRPSRLDLAALQSENLANGHGSHR